MGISNFWLKKNTSKKEKFKKAAKNIAEDKPKIEQKGLMAAPQPAQEEMI